METIAVWRVLWLKSDRVQIVKTLPILQNLSIDVIENLYRANSVYVRGSNDTVRIEKQKGYQKEANVF